MKLTSMAKNSKKCIRNSITSIPTWTWRVCVCLNMKGVCVLEHEGCVCARTWRVCVCLNMKGVCVLEHEGCVCVLEHEGCACARTWRVCVCLNMKGVCVCAWTWRVCVCLNMYACNQLIWNRCVMLGRIATVLSGMVIHEAVVFIVDTQKHVRLDAPDVSFPLTSWSSASLADVIN